MPIKKRWNLFSGLVSKFMGPIVLLVLFGLAELGPGSMADQKSPWVGNWHGRSASSLNTFTLMIEDDGSFSWTAGERRLMSGTYETVEPSVLRLHFGETQAETMDYTYQFLHPDKFRLHQSNTDIVFTRKEE